MEEVLHSAGAEESVHIMVKGKRSKRQRLSPSPALPPASSSSPSTSSGSVTEEEEDMAMANCLILLAQGPELDITVKDDDNDNNNNNNNNINNNNNNNNNNKPSSRRFTETATTTDGKAGFYVYECKDCKKCFPSFQALGGHRTSHKRKRDAGFAEDDELLKFSINSNSFLAKPMGLMPASNNNNSNVLSLKMRVHECSICGAEFSSGQALGGHMRRHRPGSVPDVADMKKEKSLLSLDLNLPAPSEDHRGDGGEATMKEIANPAFSCANKRPPLLLLSSAMVDCHYFSRCLPHRVFKTLNCPNEHAHWMLSHINIAK